MSNVKISEMTNTTSAIGSSVVPVLVGGANYKTQIEYILMTKALTATRWDDLRVPMTSTKSGGSKEPGFSVALTNGSGSQGVFCYWFDDTTEQELYFSVQLPHKYKEGTDIEPHVHWMTAANGTAGTKVCWALEYAWVNISDTATTTTIIYNNTATVDETIELKKHYITEIGTITGTGKTVSSMLLCRIYRDATGGLDTDSFVGDSGLLEIDFHYEIDSLGSATEYVK